MSGPQLGGGQLPCVGAPHGGARDGASSRVADTRLAVAQHRIVRYLVAALDPRAARDHEAAVAQRRRTPALVVDQRRVGRGLVALRPKVGAIVRVDDVFRLVVNLLFYSSVFFYYIYRLCSMYECGLKNDAPLYLAMSPFSAYHMDARREKK